MAFIFYIHKNSHFDALQVKCETQSIIFEKLFDFKLSVLKPAYMNTLALSDVNYTHTHVCMYIYIYNFWSLLPKVQFSENVTSHMPSKILSPYLFNYLLEWSQKWIQEVWFHYMPHFINTLKNIVDMSKNAPYCNFSYCSHIASNIL